MSFDISLFTQKGLPLPDALPPGPASLDLFAKANDALPDPMDLVAQGALVVANHSAGKDSQALLIHLIERLHIPREQIVVIHADLGEAEWPGTEDHARKCAEFYGLPFFVTCAQNKEGEPKNLLDYADARGQFPSRSQRWCTSDWKRGPIRREINRIRELIDHKSPYVLNAMGMRAQESVERAKLEPIEFVKDASCPSQPWPQILEHATRARQRFYFDWHPILHYSQDQVFATIEAAGQTPHWAYAAGARRLSCLCCIFSSEQDIRAAVAASDKGKAYARRIIEIEDRNNHTILPLRTVGGRKVQRYIKDVVGDLLNAA